MRIFIEYRQINYSVYIGLHKCTALPRERDLETSMPTQTYTQKERERDIHKHTHQKLHTYIQTDIKNPKWPYLGGKGVVSIGREHIFQEENTFCRNPKWPNLDMKGVVSIGREHIR